MSASSSTHRIADDAAERAIILPKHLHARPAGQVAQAAGRHRETTIHLTVSDRRVNARSILAILGLGAVTGTEILVTVEGPDATAIADEIADILNSPEAEG
jgi:phosphocarrier protein HPr